ncbi:serine/threonine-protein kinase [Mycolicibacterium celeriflavum]|uniref:non-specific serine/threonine protein kinase n=1 Tax=Mycolicibacterium celeriflavum TaxID=1249101 RepID=A0A1X0BR79_MYCCF|nr:serine/threonine-protein kinase [Mycolicibacterium celeriflavum]MCV7237379.1 serine/threonine protein kinase [Mycolicibacterium celeriflavum]ORA46006.1 serine/threonine protein kinase [Mycolicibacterium celeriflavum]BBY45986.1 protein kinase [Mycolicibacterium celeriflavum]
MLSAGDRFEGYVVDELLGHGGSATVYRVHGAEDEARVVALKILDEGHRHLAELAQLRREFDFAHRLDHPHIVTVYERGPGWLTMELIAGGGVHRLRRLLDRIAALSQIADALDYIHNRAIVHCDVKPANILLDGTRAVLIDFGVAVTITDDICRRPTQVEASLPYSAPELIAGRAPTEATDEYALACTAVELITGSPPFREDSRVGLVDAHLHHPPPRFSRENDWLPRAFDSIMAKALSKAPADRYRSCRELIALIARALQ